MMIQTGLCSITFRKLDPAKVVRLVVEAGLNAIEWGGDIHVPHGDIATARAVRRMTLDAGLQISSYGSYYRVGHGEPCPFEDVLTTAAALGAPVIRVWAGKRGSDRADATYWERVIDDALGIARKAGAEGVGIAFEYHPNTLTDTDEAAVRLLTTIDHPAVSSYWQMREGTSLPQHLDSLRSVLPWLAHVHVQASRAGERAALSAMAEEWQQLLAVVAGAGRSHVAMIEFVRGDTPAQLLLDAASLTQWVNQIRE